MSLEWWQKELPASFYDHLFERPWPTATYVPIYNWIAARVVEPVLDVGCGDGSLAHILYSARNVRRYLGIDFSEVALRKARERVPLEFQVGDARELDSVTMAKYKTLVFSEVLEHIAQDTEICARIPAGSVILGSLPRADGWGHVRFFPSSSMVNARYGNLLEFLELVPVESQWWCFNARRR